MPRAGPNTKPRNFTEKFRGGRAPYRIRTDDPLFTRQVLWPAELRRRASLAAIKATLDSLAQTIRKQKPDRNGNED